MSSKNQFSKKILKILGEKPATSVPEIAEKLHLEALPPSDRKHVYALSRSLKGLEESGFIESLHGEHHDYARLTKEGRKRSNIIKLEAENTLLDTTWDGFWRIILLDLPEDRKSEREALRYLLKKAGFVCVKNSVWISMYPFEHLFNNIKKDLDLTTELIIIVTNNLDEATEIEFLNLIRK
jgi:DNA-binding transcriptional regulator PaaX